MDVESWMAPRSTLKVKVIGQRSRSRGQIRDFRPHLTGSWVILEVKGHMGKGLRSLRSRSKVMWLKVTQKFKVKNIIRSKIIIKQVGSLQRQVAFFSVLVNYTLFKLN